MFSGNDLSVADIAAVTRNNNNDGWGGGSGIWAIIILIALFNRNGLFGGNGFGGNGGGFNGVMPFPYPFPVGGYGSAGGYGSSVATAADVQRGFDNSKVISKLDGLANGLCDGFYVTTTNINNASAAAQNTMTQGFAGLNTAIISASEGVKDAVQADTVANMQNTFALQQAINGVNVTNMQNQNALATQLANCCCENRAGQADIKYQMATNTCAINTNISNATRDITENANANTRAILDFLTQDKIATLTAENSALKLVANNAAQTDTIINALKTPCPIPSYLVPAPYPVNYGNRCGCGCGCSG